MLPGATSVPPRWASPKGTEVSRKAAGIGATLANLASDGGPGKTWGMPTPVERRTALLALAPAPLDRVMAVVASLAPDAPGEDEVVAQCLAWHDRRGALDFEIDGVVVKVDDVELQRRLGAVGRDRCSMRRHSVHSPVPVDSTSPKTSRPATSRITA